MSIHPSLVRLVAIAAALVVLVIWHGRSRPVATPPSKEAEPSAPSVAVDSVKSRAQQRTAWPTLHTDSLAPTNSVAITEEALAGMSKEEKTLHILSNDNHVPIVFYGKLQDQFDSPVAGATVDFEVRVWSGYESTVNRGREIADSKGFFTISGYKGESLSVVPKKDGYALASRNGGGKYSHLYPEEERVHPDPNNPVIIKLWKLQGADSLVDISKQYTLDYTEAPFYFDFLTGKVVPTGGDIKITISRAPGVMSGRNRLDWRVLIEGVDGGVMDSGGQEDITYWAPTSGYQPSLTIGFSTNAWNGGFNRGFFVKSRGGEVHSKLSLAFTINEKPSDPVFITFGGIASTNGSRNWEGAPNTLKPQ